MQDNRFAASIPHAVTRLFREQNRLHGRAVEPFGVSAEQAHLLTLLFTRGALSMSELGREAALSSGTLSAAVDRMEAAGLVRRRADPADRRGVLVEPAEWPAGKRERLFAALLAAEDEMLAPLSKRERATLSALLARVLDALPTEATRRTAKRS